MGRYAVYSIYGVRLVELAGVTTPAKLDEITSLPT